jgi:hypothetical protein
MHAKLRTSGLLSVVFCGRCTTSSSTTSRSTTNNTITEEKIRYRVFWKTNAVWI